MPSSPRPARIADEVRYLLFGCAVPAALFGLLGWYNLVRLRAYVFGADRVHSLGALLSGPIERGLYLLFVSIPVFVYITRPRAIRRAGGLAPRAAAFVGTLMLLVFPAFFDAGTRIATPPVFVHAIADVTGVVFSTFGVYALLYLRNNFSIIPEARRFVTAGPYRYVRHPVYVAEIGVAVSLALQGDLHIWSTLILVPFVGVQIVRSRFEERLLGNTFPGYNEYRDHTGAFLPLASHEALGGRDHNEGLAHGAGRFT